MNHNHKASRKIQIYLDERLYQQILVLLKKARARYDPDRSLSSLCSFLLEKALKAVEASSEYGPSLPDLQVPPIQELREENSQFKKIEEAKREENLKEELRFLEQLKKQWSDLREEQKKKHIETLNSCLKSSDLRVQTAAKEILQLSQESGASSNENHI